MGLGLAAVDSRVKTVVAAVAALSAPWLYPIMPTNISPAVKVPVLLMAGRSDELITMEESGLLYESLPGPKEFLAFDAGHELPSESNQQAADWLRHHLQSR
jgi:predicted esterase